jgi:hypothetical protein
MDCDFCAAFTRCIMPDRLTAFRRKGLTNNGNLSRASHVAQPPHGEPTV